MLKRIVRRMGMRDLQERDPAEVRTVFLMLLMFVFINADAMLMVPSFRAIRDEFDQNEAAVGLVASLFVFSGAGIALVWGYLADRYPRKLLVFFTILLGEIPCLLTGYVRTFEQLFWIRTLTGLGLGGIIPLIYSMIGDLVTDRERATASSWIGLAEGLGLAAGMALAGNLVESQVSFLGASGWRLPFVLAALPNFLLAPLFLIIAKEPPRGGGERALQQELARGREYKRRIRLSDYRTIFSNRTNLYFILQAVPGTIGWGVLPNWVVAYYQEKNVSAALATNLNLLIGLGMILGGFCGGIIGDKLHRRNKKYSPLLCGITTLLGLAFFLVMLHWPLPAHPAVADMAGPLAIGIIGGFLITVTSSNIRAIVLNVNPPENRGAMMSIFTLSDSIGKGLGPLLGGILIVALGYVRTLDLATLAWIPCALVFLFLLTPQYPKDAERLDRLMAERAKEMEPSH